MVERRRSTGRPARTRRWPRLGPRWSVEPQPRARRPTQRRLRWLGCYGGLPLGRGSPVVEEKEAEAVVHSAREERDRRQGTAAADRSSARRPWWCLVRPRQRGRPGGERRKRRGVPTAVEGHSGGGGGAASGWRRKEQGAALLCSRPWRTCASARSGAEQGDNEREEENGESRGRARAFKASEHGAVARMRASVRPRGSGLLCSVGHDEYQFEINSGAGNTTTKIH